MKNKLKITLKSASYWFDGLPIKKLHGYKSPELSIMSDNLCFTWYLGHCLQVWIDATSGVSAKVTYNSKKKTQYVNLNTENYDQFIQLWEGE